MPDPPRADRPAPVRLRLACDACSTTKVKCDKARPACQRCVDNGLYCVYSISRRNGSKPWYKRVQRSQSQSQSQGQNIHERLSFYPQDAIPTALLTAPRSLTPGPDPMGSLSFCPDDAAGGTWADLDFALSSHSELVGGGGGGGEDRDHDQDQDHGNGDSPWMSPLGGSPGAILFTGMAEQQASRPEHDCEDRASNLLRSLHYDPTFFTDVTVRPTPATPPGGSVTIPSVDKIILANRTALATLPDLFDCPCSRYPHMALLDVAILSKVLFWYRVAICALNTPSQSEGGTGTDDASVSGQQQQTESNGSVSSASTQPGSTDSGKNNNSKGQGNAPNMRPVSIHLGELQLDAEDQAILQRSILLRELQKMDKLIHKFRELDVCWAAEDTRDSGNASIGDASASQWCRLAMPKICQELEALCRMANGNGEDMS